MFVVCLQELRPLPGHIPVNLASYDVTYKWCWVLVVRLALRGTRCDDTCHGWPY